MFYNKLNIDTLRPDVDSPFIIFSKETPDYKITDHFTLHEFLTKDFKSSFTRLRLDLIYEICLIRQQLGQPIWISSTYRSTSYNRLVGGAKSSYHIKGMAIDLQCNPAYHKALLHLLTGSSVIRGVGVYKGFFHVDTGPVRLFVG